MRLGFYRRRELFAPDLNGYEMVMVKDYDMATRLTGLPPQKLFLSPRMAMVFAFLAESAARIRKKPPTFTRNAVRHPARNPRFDCSRAETELGMTFMPVETSVREWIVWWIENGMVAQPERLLRYIEGGVAARPEQLYFSI